MFSLAESCDLDVFHPKLFTSFRVGATEIMAVLFVPHGTQRELEPSLHTVMFSRKLQGQRVRRAYPGALPYSRGEEWEVAFRVYI